MISISRTPDTFGALASSLCLVHCIATPFLFIAQSSSLARHVHPPSWWSFLDYAFLLVSFLAVYRSTQTTSIAWIKPSLWFSWAALFIVIWNEKIGLLALPEVLTYIPTLALVALHVYNKKYCDCNKNECCTNENS